MDMVTEVTKKVKSLFSIEWLDALAKDTGFIKRKKKIIAKDFLCHHLCLGLSKETSITDIAEEFLACNNIEVTKQAIHKKVHFPCLSIYASCIRRADGFYCGGSRFLKSSSFCATSQNSR